ncbi:MAG: sodium-dependent transporter [Clostridiales bacterium]|nr:sodium-dependent transporter [Candidatus Crickella merdequi]
MDKKNNNRESWSGTFGFLMAAVGSAVGLGNLWGFPYKMGANGGFAFLVMYLILVVFAGYVLVMTELALGRATGKSIIPAYRVASNGKMTFVGIFSALAPFFIFGFYCYLGGIATNYAVANIGDIFGAAWGVNGVDGTTYFADFFTNQVKASIFTIIFMVVTIFIVSLGVSGGIEKFNRVAMPGLFILLLIIVVRSCTLTGAGEGIAFMLKPDFTVFQGSGWIHVLAAAGGQMFFSVSLGMGILVTYGSYMKKDADIALSGLAIPLADTIIAVLAGLAIMPAVFAFGMEPSAGPGLLFMTLQNVFNSMGAAGPFFGTLFYLLVTIAALTSSMSVLEAISSSFIDSGIDKGKGNQRKKIVWIFGLITMIEGILVSIDGLGTYLPPLFGRFCWLDGFDLLAEGLLMPIAAFCTVIYFGWIKKGFLQEEIRLSSTFKSEKFYSFCLKYIAPVFCFFILLGQIDSFFGLGWF